MQNSGSRIIPLILIPLLLYSCKSNNKVEAIHEGIIEYEISYYQDEDTNPLIGLMPTTLEFRFKGKKSSTRVVGWLGVFSLMYITDEDLGTNYTLLKVLNKKQSYSSDINEPIPGYITPDSFNIEYLNDKKSILGYHCNKALLHIPNHEFSPIPIFYSNDLNINSHFFKSTYLNEVPGFLFEFPVAMNGIDMQLKIKKITECPIPDEEFSIPDDYQSVSKEKMHEIINEII